jgi:hypothetical protein
VAEPDGRRRAVPVLVFSAICLALLAAHFFRAGHDVIAALLAGFCAFAFVRRPWAARILQATLTLGSIEWLRTLAALVAARSAAGQPYLRLVVILALVAAFTAATAAALNRSTARRFFNFPGQSKAHVSADPADL